MKDKLKTYTEIYESLSNNLNVTEKFMDKGEIRGYNASLNFLQGSIEMLEKMINFIDEIEHN